MSDSDYRQHMAEYFRMRAEGSSSPDYSPDANHPTDGYEPAKATPSEIEWGAEGQYEPTTNYSLDGYTPIDSVVVEAPLGHGVAFDLGAEGRPYPDASVPDIFEDLPRQNAEISGVDFQADAIIEGTEIDSGEVRLEPVPVQEGRSLDGYTAMDSVVEQAPQGHGVPQWYGRAEGSAGDQVVSWEDGAGVSSPSAPPSDIFWAESKKDRIASGKDMHYAVPSEKKYPIWDKAHARMALAWSKGTKFAGQVERAVTKRFPSMAAENHELNAWGAEFAALGEPDAPYDQGYDDQQDESIGERHRGRHEQSLKDRRDEADAMDKRHSRMGRKYDDVVAMDAEFMRKGMCEAAQNHVAEYHGEGCTCGAEHHKGQGYDDEMDESLGMRHRGRHSQSFKDRRNEAAAMDKRHSRMGRKYDDVATMDAEGWGKTCGVEDRDTDEPCTAPATVNLQDILMEYEVGEDPYEKMHLGEINEFFCKKHYDEMDDMWAETKGSEHHKGQGYNDELDESLGMSHKEFGMKQSFKDRRDESKGTEKFDHSRAYSRVKAMDAENMGLTQYVGSAGGSGDGTPVSYGGIALPESDVAAMVESSTENPMGASIGTVMGTMGAEDVPVVPDPSSFPQGDGRVLGQQTDQANLSPLHAENEDVQMVKIQDPVTTGAKMALGVVALNATAIAGAALIGLALTYSARKEE